jgi:hypothetical protein
MQNTRKRYRNFSLGDVTVVEKKEEPEIVFPVESRFVITSSKGLVKKKARKPRASSRALGTNPRAKGTNPRNKQNLENN